MKTFITALVLALAGAANAAGLFGSVTVDGRLPTSEMRIDLVCAGRPAATGMVDTRGSYRIVVPAVPSNPCEVRIENAAAPVVLYANPTRYDFALTHPGGNALLTQR